MPSVCLYFQVHQPFRLRRYSVFDTDRDYFDELKNAELCKKVAAKCYLPANQMLLDNIRRHDGNFRVAFSISGVALEQFAQSAPEVIDSFHALNQTGCVEFLN
jgi:alpha-amylase